MLNVGDRAPDWSGTTGEGKRLASADLRGKPYVVFFYPKDNTTVCTKEACGFRDLAGEIGALGAAVVGVSNDTEASHQKFTSDHRLNFPLLADTDGAIAKAFGVARLGGMLAGWIPVRRVTFVVDGEGVIRGAIESELSADKHTSGALEALSNLQRAKGAHA